MALDERFGLVLAAARCGADWAWRVLYREFAPQLLRYARANRVPDADDVLGEVFLSAVRGLASFEGDEGAFRAWLFALTRNRIIDERRKVVRRRTEPVPVEILAEVASVGDAEADALRALAADRIRAILSNLTPDQHDILLLRILGGLTIDEIASVVGKRAGAVKALQARGVGAIRREIARGAVTL